MRYETSVVYLESIPELTLKTGFDLVTVLSFLITAIVVAIGAVVSIKTSNKNLQEQRRMFEKSIEQQDRAAAEQRAALEQTLRSQESSLQRTLSSQEAIAKSTAIKVSRQEWINELRGACSEYIAAIDLLQYQVDSKIVHNVFIEKVTQEDSSKAAELVASWEQEKRISKQAALALRAKIELLSNPNELEFQEIILLVREALEKAQKERGSSKETCDEIISKAQAILKTEWNRTKNME